MFSAMSHLRILLLLRFCAINDIWLYNRICVIISSVHLQSLEVNISFSKILFQSYSCYAGVNLLLFQQSVQIFWSEICPKYGADIMCTLQ